MPLHSGSLDSVARRACAYLESLATRRVAPTPQDVAFRACPPTDKAACAVISLSSWATTTADVEASLSAIIRAAQLAHAPAV